VLLGVPERFRRGASIDVEREIFTGVTEAVVLFAHAVERRASVRREVSEVVVLDHVDRVLPGDPAKPPVESQRPLVARGTRGIDGAQQQDDVALFGRRRPSGQQRYESDCGQQAAEKAKTRSAAFAQIQFVRNTPGVQRAQRWAG